MNEDEIFHGALDALIPVADYINDKCCIVVRHVIGTTFMCVALTMMLVYLPVTFVLNFGRLLRGIGRSFMKGFRGGDK